MIYEALAGQSLDLNAHGEQLNMTAWMNPAVSRFILNLTRGRNSVKSQSEKARLFQSLHEREGAFIIPNPWDVGTARLLEHIGFEALATTSAGYAFSRGVRDNEIDRDEMIAHISDICSATDLPVSADLENGFGDSPEAVAETIRLGAEAGLAGGSIEDSTQRSPHAASAPIYEFDLAVERIRAAAEAARSLPIKFTLTGRCENYLVGRPDLAGTIARLQAYQEAGADVLYAPGLPTKEAMASVVSSVDRPVNVVMGLAGVSISLAELSDLGVKRVSTGSALSRAALGAFLNAANEMQNEGTFGFADEAVSYKDLSVMFRA